jgi:hypothetical protein
MAGGYGSAQVLDGVGVAEELVEVGGQGGHVVWVAYAFSLMIRGGRGLGWWPVEGWVFMIGYEL